MIAACEPASKFRADLLAAALFLARSAGLEKGAVTAGGAAPDNATAQLYRLIAFFQDFAMSSQAFSIPAFMSAQALSLACCSSASCFCPFFW